MRAAAFGLALLMFGAVTSQVSAQEASEALPSEEEAAEEEAAAPATPTCAEGREATERSQGRCCWPGQGWSEQYGRCSGPPACPSALVAEGDDCVAPVAVTPPPPLVPTPPGTAVITPDGHAPVSWDSFEDERPRGGLAPELTYTADEGWMIFGGVAFGAGWAFSIVIGSIGGLASNICSELGGYAFIPLVGGLVHAATLEQCAVRTADAGPYWAPYATSSAAQLAGIVAFLAAVIAEDAEALEFQSLTFSVPGADFGLGYETHF